MATKGGLFVHKEMLHVVESNRKTRTKYPRNIWGNMGRNQKRDWLSTRKYPVLPVISSPSLHCLPLHHHQHPDNQQHCQTVRKIGGTRVLVPGHQNSGAPTFFFGVFLMVFSHLCWQCSDKTRKCQEHINTLRKKEKLIFLKPILEIKTKNLFST